MERGDEVTVVSFRGVLLQRRVWEDAGVGVLVCSENDYQQALLSGDEPLFVGFPKRDIIDVETGRKSSSPSVGSPTLANA
jgi:hypothetical protein